MADFTARIKPKKSSTAGEVPQAADLEVAELAVNTADGKLFVKHTDDSIKEISGGGKTLPFLVGYTAIPAGLFNSSSATVTIPDGVQSGDTILIGLSHRSGIDSTLTNVPAPSGFTRILSQGYTSTSATTASLYTAVYTKVADGTESGTTVTFTATVSDVGDDWNYAAHVWRNVGSIGTPTYEDTMPSPGGTGPTWYTVGTATDPVATYVGFMFNVYSYAANGMMFRFQTANGGSLNHLSDTLERTSGKRGHSWYQRAGTFQVGTHNSILYFSSTVVGLTDGLHVIMVPLLPA